MDLMDIDHDVRQDPNEGVDAEAEQEIAGVENEEQEEDLPDKTWPTLEEYQRKWDTGLQQHSRPNAGPFSNDNLVPEPVPQLWQDVPHVPFKKLKTDDAMARLSRCRPIAGFRESHADSAGIHYAHNSGEVNFRRRAPLQLASTLGFILSKKNGKFMRLKPDELDSLHECLVWLRQPGNNPLNFYGNELEDRTVCFSSIAKTSS